MECLHKLKLIFVCTILISSVCFIKVGVETTDLVRDPEVDMNIMEIILSKGYPVEVHEVTTADGYILTLLRIPPFKQKRSSNNCNQTPVLLMHGLLVDSASFVINFPNQSLGYILADQGYDVFLGNMRGTKMSKRHLKFTPDSSQFWNFGLEDIAMNDIPAMIDAVLKITGEDQLMYIGMSQGTTVAFILLSQSPEYNKKIKLFIALAPVTTLYHMTNNYISSLVPLTNFLALMLNGLQMYEINKKSLGIDFMQRMWCIIKGDSYCKKLIFIMYDVDQQEVNMTRYPVYEKHLSSSTSAKNFKDFAQMKQSGIFQKYDYGWSGNLRVYNRPTPPIYDVTKITTPVILVWAEEDNISEPRDVRSLWEQLRTVVWSYQVPRKNFKHSDYILALDVKEVLYDALLSRTCNYLTMLTGT